MRRRLARGLRCRVPHVRFLPCGRFDGNLPHEQTSRKQQRGEDQQLHAGDALMAAVAMEPGEHDGERQSHGGDDRRNAGDGRGPLESCNRELDALHEAPGDGNVGKAPLHHLAVPYGAPEPLRTGLVGVGQVALPSARGERVLTGTRDRETCIVSASSALGQH